MNESRKLRPEQGEVAKAARLDSSQILSAAGHDLRQPMHSLSLILDTLSERVDDPEIASLVKNAQISADGVTSVLETLLSIAAMKTCGAQPAFTEFNINDLLNHCRGQFNRRAENNDLELRVTPSTLGVRSDRLMLQGG